MLTLFDSGHAREGYSRRDFLKIGALGIGGLTLADTMALRAKAEGHLRDKSVVMLFLQGGPTHVETFDPKMTAPVEYRSMFGEVATKLPGVTFGGTFPKMAALADKLAVVRSFRHGIGSHGKASLLVASGGNPTGANMGSFYAKIAGANHPRTGTPTNALLFPAAVGDAFKKLYKKPDRIGAVGDLGSAYQPFDPSSGGEIVRNMELKVPRNRFDDRRQLLTSLDNLRRKVDASDALSGVDNITRQAYDVLLGGASKAFDISQEDPRTLAMYDTSKHVIPKPVLRKKRKTTPMFSPVALGKQMLLARRLCEAGCGYVTVSSSGWDMHGNAFGIDDGIACLGPAVDQAVSAFVQDVHDRGLDDKILLVITGEFGRTPKINKKRGRDHWGNLCPLVFSGGGLQMGQVIGSSDRRVSVPASEPVSISDVMGTIMHTLFDVGALRVTRGVPTNIIRAIDQAAPIARLV